MNVKNDVDIEGARKTIVEALKATGGVVIAFSGGVDSSVVAALAHGALGERAVAVTADSATLPPGELEIAKKIAKHIGINHIVLQHNELSVPGVAENPPERCYHCKLGLLKLLSRYAKENDFKSVAEGTNASELTGHRPGFRAVKETGVLTPLADAGLSKNDVRELARRLGLPNSEKPSMACLSSRFPYGTPITPEALKRVGGAERALHELGFDTVRVRDHGDVARIEVSPDEIVRIIGMREEVVESILSTGYAYVALDFVGYRTGSMDEVLNGVKTGKSPGLKR